MTIRIDALLILAIIVLFAVIVMLLSIGHHPHCSDFRTQEDAQVFMNKNHAAYLDHNGDGIACNGLPTAVPSPSHPFFFPPLGTPHATATPKQTVKATPRPTPVTTPSPSLAVTPTPPTTPEPTPTSTPTPRPCLPAGLVGVCIHV